MSHKVQEICHKELKDNNIIIVIYLAVLTFSVPYTTEKISNGCYPHFGFIVTEREEWTRRLQI
jgi:hypothetical protein